MNTLSCNATIDAYQLTLQPDGTLILKTLNSNEPTEQITLNAAQSNAIYTFFRRSDVVNQLENRPPAD